MIVFHHVHQVALLIFAATGAFAAEADNWPVILPLEEKQTYLRSGNGGDTPFIAVVKNVTGVPSYKLECHNGDYDDTSDFNYSGDFQCYLFALKDGQRSSYNLLANPYQATVSDWFNRGRMFADQISEQCGGFAEYGRIRHFRLRGMVVTFRFDDLEWFPFKQFNRVRLRKFTFRVSFVPDKNALTEVAEAVSVAIPPKACYPIPEKSLDNLCFRMQISG